MVKAVPLSFTRGSHLPGQGAVQKLGIHLPAVSILSLPRTPAPCCLSLQSLAYYIQEPLSWTGQSRSIAGMPRKDLNETLE